jgi:hypothetical protein
LRGHQRYLCNRCGHQWLSGGGRRHNWARHYAQWLQGRRTLQEIAVGCGISIPALREKFDNLALPPAIRAPEDGPVSLLIDAVFFGRDYGYLCFHDGKRIVHFREVGTESLADLEAGLDALGAAGYRFRSFTLDGRPGFIRLLKARFPGLPVQMCHFHQKAIIRRYITNSPKTACGKALKDLMARFGRQEPQDWIQDMFALQNEYRLFLAEKNENGQFTHRRLRSAFRSLKTNLPHLFPYHEMPEASIPHTTNRLEGSFSHIKEKIRIHRGLRKDRKKKAIQYLMYWT